MEKCLATPRIPTTLILEAVLSEKVENQEIRGSGLVNNGRGSHEKGRSDLIIFVREYYGLFYKL